MQQLTERGGVRGDITISVIEAATGNVMRRMEIRNLIVTNGLTLIGNLLKGYTPLANTVHLGEIQVGRGVTAPVTGNTAIEVLPTAGSTALPVTVTVSTVANQVEVKCTAQLGTGSCNGDTISEAGLFTLDSTNANPSMFARQVYPGVPKTIALSIVYDWRITFTA